MKFAIILMQFIIIMALAPFVSGLVAKIKNNIRMRKGPGVFQPYYNLIKLISKDEVISDSASWIFKIAPFMVFVSVVTVCLLVVMCAYQTKINYMGDFFAVIFILAFGRFFLSLAGLDTGSSFGGMGSSREMFISSLVEPVAGLSIFALSLPYTTTSLVPITNPHAIHISSIVAAVSLFIVVIAETSRLPVDNQETHLELTMIHEAMILEYSGRRLALIEFAVHLKQMVWFLILINVLSATGLFYSYNFPQMSLGVLIIFAKIVIIAVIVAVVEVSVAKMRLFRVVDFLTFSLVLAVIALIAAIFGV